MFFPIQFRCAKKKNLASPSNEVGAIKRKVALNVRGGEGIERNVPVCPKTQDYNKMAYSEWAATRTKRCPSTVGQCCCL